LTCPPVHIYNEQLPQAKEVKYLGLHLDRRLTWHKYIFAKRKHLGITLGHKSRLSMSNKLLLYTDILKPIWTYGIQLWGSASTSNIEILERFQSKADHVHVILRRQLSQLNGRKLKLKLKLICDRRSVGQCVLVSGSCLEHMTRFFFSV
jgi:hypothetical protein